MPDNYTTRSDADVADLVPSIMALGIVDPLPAIKLADGYQLLGGERRFRAAKLIGLKEVPLFVCEKPLSKGEADLLMALDNEQAGVNPMDTAVQLGKIQGELRLKQTELAERLGMSKPKVNKYLALLVLPVEVQQLIRDGKFGVEKGYELSQRIGEAAFDELLKLVVAGKPLPAAEKPNRPKGQRLCVAGIMVNVPKGSDPLQHVKGTAQKLSALVRGFEKREKQDLDFVAWLKEVE